MNRPASNWRAAAEGLLGAHWLPAGSAEECKGTETWLLYLGVIMDGTHPEVWVLPPPL